MPVPKTPEQTSPVSPLLQYDETGPAVHWAQTYQVPSRPYAYPDYSTLHEDPTRNYPGYLAYDDPAPAAYTAATYEEPATDPPAADRSYELTSAASGYDYYGGVPRSAGVGGAPYTWVDVAHEDDASFDEECIDEKAAMEYDDLYEYPQPQTMRFGVPPEEPTRRRGTKLKKKVVLTDGNLVVDLPVPSNLRLGRMQDVMDEMRSVRWAPTDCKIVNTS